MKFISIIVVSCILILVIYYSAEPSVVEVSPTATVTQPDIQTDNTSHSLTGIPTNINTEVTNQESIQNKQANSPKASLSPEMKQAIKEKLLHNAPLDIQKDANGRTILRHNGRFTHMPVATKQPDGSVKIKEYSHISENK